MTPQGSSSAESRVQLERVLRGILDEVSADGELLSYRGFSDAVDEARALLARLDAETGPVVSR